MGPSPKHEKAIKEERKRLRNHIKSDEKRAWPKLFSPNLDSYEPQYLEGESEEKMHCVKGEKKLWEISPSPGKKQRGGDQEGKIKGCIPTSGPYSSQKRKEGAREKIKKLV